MRPIRLAALSNLLMMNSVIAKQLQSFIKPGPTPPVPAEATAFSGTHPPCLIRLRLQVYLPSQVLQTNGRLYHLVPASRCCRKIVTSRVPSLPGRYSGSSLIRTHPPPSRLSIHFPLFTVIESTLLRKFLSGTRRASPVAQYVLITVLSLPPRQSD